MRWGIITTIALFCLVFSLPQVSAISGCGVMTGQGLEPDYDCDGIVDFADNCPWHANSQQEDINRNGVGDYCDLLIEEVIVNPDSHIRQGEFATLTIRVINNREGPLEDINVQVRSSRLGLDSVQDIPYLPAGESAVAEFWFRIPKCQDEGSYSIGITTVLKDPLTGKTSTEVQSQMLYVEEGDVCGSADGPLDGTIIEVLQKVDLDRGEAAIIPINIVNMADEQQTYHVSVEPLGSWGSWRVDPSASLTLPAGNDGVLYLYLDTEGHTWPGNQNVHVVVSSGEQRTTIPVQIYVRAPAYSAGSNVWFLVVQWLIVIALLFLIVAAIVIALIHTKNGKKAEPPVTAKKKVTKKVSKKSRKKVAVEKAPNKKRETYY